MSLDGTSVPPDVNSLRLKPSYVLVLGGGRGSLVLKEPPQVGMLRIDAVAATRLVEPDVRASYACGPIGCHADFGRAHMTATRSSAITLGSAGSLIEHTCPASHELMDSSHSLLALLRELRLVRDMCSSMYSS